MGYCSFLKSGLKTRKDTDRIAENRGSCILVSSDRKLYKMAT